MTAPLAWDNIDGDITEHIVTVNPVDTNAPGIYIVTYTVTNSFDIPAQEAIRTVTVADTTPPVITLLGSPSVMVECRGNYIDPGATAQDACDGDLTAAMVTANPVNTA